MLTSTLGVLAFALVKRLIAGALIAGAATFGLVAGAGDSEAKIKEGNYKSQGLIYGFVPTPESDSRVVGNTIQQNYYGLGPVNLSQAPIRQTKNGGVVAPYPGPVGEWLTRTEYHRTKNGYVGTQYVYGVPLATTLLKEKPKGR